MGGRLIVDNRLPFPCFLVDPDDMTELSAAVEPLIVLGIDLVVEPVPAVDVLPIFEPYREPPLLGARTFPGTEVLHATINVVGMIHVHSDGIDLGHGKLVRVVPAGALIVGDRHAVVVAHQHVARIPRIDPKGVIVSTVSNSK